MKGRLLHIILYIIIALIFTITLILLGRAAVYKYYPLEYDEFISEYCNENELDINIVRALIFTESRYNKDAVSNKNAYGLMQITPDTKDWICEKYGIDIPNDSELFEPDINIMIGCSILKSHYEEFGNSVTVLAAYNAGRGTVINWLEDTDISEDGVTLNTIPYAETAEYVRKITKTADIYKRLYDKER